MGAPPMFQIASASGNGFAYLWADAVPPEFDGPRWARTLCPRGSGLGLDGLFLLDRPAAASPWRMEHWDADGSATFCGNGTRAALAVPGAPAGPILEVLSNGTPALLRREGGSAALRLPEGEGFGLRPAALDLPGAWAFGWIGNPQLVVEVAEVAAVDLARFAPPLRHHPALAEGANVNILEVLSPGHARIRSWERGVEGETLCCGTGCAVAGAWLAQRTGLRRWTLRPAGADPVTVEVGSMDEARWHDLWLSGPVHRIAAVTPDAGLGLG